MKTAKGGGTVIIGMGNPLLSDDGVGIAVAHAVAARLNRRVNLTVTELHTGGIRLMEAMAGFSRAVVVDAMLTGAPPGTVRRFDQKDFVTTKNTFSSHDTDFSTAYELGVMAGVTLPRQVSFWGIEAREFDSFGEQYKPAEIEFFRDILNGVLKDQTAIDQLIDATLADGWPLARVEAVMRAVMRAATYELRKRKDIPAKVVITEYVDVAAAFLGRDETGMINAVLDKIARELRDPVEFEPRTR